MVAPNRPKKKLVSDQRTETLARILGHPAPGPLYSLLNVQASAPPSFNKGTCLVDVQTVSFIFRIRRVFWQVVISIEMRWRVTEVADLLLAPLDIKGTKFVVGRCVVWVAFRSLKPDWLHSLRLGEIHFKIRRMIVCGVVPYTTPCEAVPSKSFFGLVIPAPVIASCDVCIAIVRASWFRLITLEKVVEMCDY